MFEIVFPTHNRPSELEFTLKSLYSTLPLGADVRVTVIHDAPPDDDLGRRSVEVAKKMLRPNDRHFINKHKSSLSQLWNQCIYESDKDWVLIASDDIEYLPGWYEHLIQEIKSAQFLQIMMTSYCAFCLHKSMVLHLGWFDERFLGGYYEDNDWQLRISEAKLKDLVSYTDNEKLILNRPTTTHKWHCINNHLWIMDKWHNRTEWLKPSFRQVGEEDWHPDFTRRYERLFSIESQIPEINRTKIKNGVGVFH